VGREARLKHLTLFIPVAGLIEGKPLLIESSDGHKPFFRDPEDPLSLTPETSSGVWLQDRTVGSLCHLVAIPRIVSVYVGGFLLSLTGSPTARSDLPHPTAVLPSFFASRASAVYW
jgi:hypothetical protein